MNQELRHVLAPELLRQLAARPLDAGYTQQVVVMGRTVTVHELTTAEVRRWFMELAQEEAGFDLVTETLIPGVSLRTIARMSDVTLEELDEFTASQLQALVTVCREVNPHFFLMGEILMEASQAVTTLAAS